MTRKNTAATKFNVNTNTYIEYSKSEWLVIISYVAHENGLIETMY